MSSPIAFQINGRSCSVPAPLTIIEAADQLGIYIPRFCYHKKLSVVANCRMCLVEVEGMNKPLPACATSIMPNMHILTRSAKTKAAQEAVMEFLLINHPLDCPICDQGGQCELQDLAMRYGEDHSDFGESKRAVPNDDLGPLVATEMTRCIQCTRCVRFGSEIAGKMELGATGRGEHMQITTYVKRHLQSELSGNMIDVCPVGALTSKPFRFTARAWEIKSVASIAPHDCLGSHLYLHVYDQRVVRVVPRSNERINEVWLSDRDRYSYLGLASPERLTHPMIKIGNSWKTTDWPTALGQATRLLKAALHQYGAQELGGLISPSATLEEMYLFQRLCRRLGSSNIDHRLREVDTRDQQYMPRVPHSDIAICDLEQCDLVILIGSNVQREQPLLITRLRKVVAGGGSVVSLNCVDYDFSFETVHKVVVSPDHLAQQVLALACLCGAELLTPDFKVISDINLEKVAQKLRAAKRTAILLGAVARNHPQASYIRYGVSQLATRAGASVMHLTEGANSAGAWIGGAVPHRIEGGQPLSPEAVGMTASEMIQAGLKAYLLFNIEPNIDCANPAKADAAMASADCVVAFSAFTSPSLLSSAQVLLPIHCFGENSGTLVNVEGKWQSFEVAVPGVGESRPGWQVLQTLDKILQPTDRDYLSLSLIREEIQKKLSAGSENDLSQSLPALTWMSMMPKDIENESLLMRITEWPLYSVDSLVRRATALQQSGSREKTGAYLHPHCAERWMLKSGQRVRLRQSEGVSEALPIIIHAGIPDNCVWTPAGCTETSGLGTSFGVIEILSESKNE